MNQRFFAPQNWTDLRSKLKLVTDKERLNYENPTDVNYVYSGHPSPLAIYLFSLTYPTSLSPV